MKSQADSNTFYYMLAISLALNLFFLPVLAGRWFWSSRAERTSMEELHPAQVKTVTLHTPKVAPPKLIPKQRIAPPLHPEHPAAQPKTKPILDAPRPHVMMIEGDSAARSSASSITQGKGEAGVPTAPTLPPPPAPPQGETRQAAAVSSPVPEIPDSLRWQTLKTFVRAQFDIAPDGTSQVTLLTGSGSSELDQLTLESLRRWRWKPALQNGVPVSSTQQIKIEFEVQ